MNHDLNMQLIEQLTVANQTTPITVPSFCQQLYQAFQSQLESFLGLSLYHQHEQDWMAKVQHPDDATPKPPSADIQTALLTALKDEQLYITGGAVYLSLYCDSDVHHILQIAGGDSEQLARIRWSIFQGLLACQYGSILAHASVEETQQLQASLTAMTDENQRLLKDTEAALARLSQQVEIQSAINDLATFASTNRDEQLLLDKGADTLLKTLAVDHVGIMLIDDEGTTAHLMSDRPARETSIRQIPVTGEIWDALARGEHQIIENVGAHDDMADASKKSLEAMKIHSTIFIPFIDLSGKLMGSVGLDQFEGRIKLSDEQIQTAKLINAQLVSQLQNLRLLKDSQRFANQMQQIAKFGETVQSRLEMEEILQTTLHFANRIFDIDYAGIVLYDERQQKLIVRAYHLHQRDVVMPINNPTMPIENTVIGAVWQNREPVYVPDLAGSDYSHPIAEGINVLYAVALISRGVTRGAIEIGRSEAKSIRMIDRSVLSQLSNQLAVALENTTTFSQSQRLAQNKALANEIALQLQQQMDMDGLLNTTINELGKALGAKRARIRLGVQRVAGDN